MTLRILAPVLALLAVLALPAYAQIGHPEMEALQAKAAQGDPEANFQIGRIHYFGLHVPQNYEASIPYLEKAASQNHSEANIYLYALYSIVRDFPSNEEKSLQHRRQAATALGLGPDTEFHGFAKAGSPLSQYFIGVVLWNQQSPFTIDDSIEWLQKSSRGGNPEAQDYLGINLLNDKDEPFGRFRPIGNIFAPKNSPEAISWLEKAAEQGFLPSQSLMGWINYLGKYDLPIDYAKAGKWLRIAAHRNHPAAQNLYGVFLLDGHGGEEKINESKDWILRAAMQNDPNALVNMGRLYLKGDLVPQDYVEAYAWLDLANDAGVPDDPPGEIFTTLMELRFAMSRSDRKLAKARSQELAREIRAAGE